jgi:hypothetical protein
MTFRPSAAAPILSVLAIVLTLVGLYVSGYFWLGERSDIFTSRNGRHLSSERHPGMVLSHINRYYAYEWQATVFYPAAQIETWLRRVHVNSVPPVVPQFP